MPESNNIIQFPSGYSIAQFESDMQNIKPRAFDTYILPAFLIYFAIKAKQPIGRKARRVLFVAGVYMFYRNYSEYKKLALQLSSLVQSGIVETHDGVEPQGVAALQSETNGGNI